MLDVILIVVVGRAFYALAVQHQKSPWPFAILGSLSGYIGIIVGGFIIGIAAELISPGFVDSTPPIVLGLFAIPFGLFTCWLTYTLLKKAWSKPKDISRATLDSDLIETNKPTTRSEDNRYDQSER
jgi:hypothetical protein